MSDQPEASKSQTKVSRSTPMSYIVGYLLSVYLTVTAYLIITNRVNSKSVLVSLVVGLALVQFIVQLLFFLHLGRETRPRWKFVVFLFMLLVVGILVFGSLWIMSNLNYRMTLSPMQVNNYLNSQQGL